MKPTKSLTATALASIMALTSGCSLLPDPSSESVPPITNQFKQGDDSYAMDILNAGWGGDIPFSISDTEIPEDAIDGNGNAGLYMTQATLGTLANGVIGGALGLTSVAVLTPSNHDLEQLESFIWIPANGRDINNMKDREEFIGEITTDYLEPMYKSFLASSYTGNITSSTKGSFSFKGEACSRNDHEKICEVNITSTMNRLIYRLQFVSYADKQHGLPFKTNNNGEFVIARLRLPFYSLIKHNKNNNVFFFIPAGSSQHPNDYQYTNIPYIKSTTGDHFFVKPTYKINN
ncbi:hypothetical protein VXS05_17000 [Photobacterium toruni]|uniref:hypothetical protein n=1 Tax=Photobacterium toruni TaxID=1935446 RepID=UPI002E188541|nr:hypothetical protein [Photobacterium toruni]